MSEIIESLSKLKGKTISKIEVVSICHILRLYLDDEWMIDLCGSWRYRSEKSILLGAMNIDFYVDVDDDLLNEEDAFYSKKAGSLLGKKIKNISGQRGDVFFELSGNRFIDLFDLSSDGLSIMLRRAG